MWCSRPPRPLEEACRHKRPFRLSLRCRGCKRSVSLCGSTKSSPSTCPWITQIVYSSTGRVDAAASRVCAASVVVGWSARALVGGEPRVVFARSKPASSASSVAQPGWKKKFRVLSFGARRIGRRTCSEKYPQPNLAWKKNSDSEFWRSAQTKPRLKKKFRFRVLVSAPWRSAEGKKNILS